MEQRHQFYGPKPLRKDKDGLRDVKVIDDIKPSKRPYDPITHPFDCVYFFIKVNKYKVADISMDIYASKQYLEFNVSTIRNVKIFVHPASAPGKSYVKLKFSFSPVSKGDIDNFIKEKHVIALAQAMSEVADVPLQCFLWNQRHLRITQEKGKSTLEAKLSNENVDVYGNGKIILRCNNSYAKINHAITFRDREMTSIFNAFLVHESLYGSTAQIPFILYKMEAFVEVNGLNNITNSSFFKSIASSTLNSPERSTRDHKIGFVLGLLATILVIVIMCHYAICVRNKTWWRRVRRKLFLRHSYKKFDDDENRDNDSTKGGRYADHEHTPKDLDASVWATRYPGGMIDEISTLSTSSGSSTLNSWKWISWDFDNANNSIGELQLGKARDINDETTDAKEYKMCYQIIYDPEDGNCIYIDSDSSDTYAKWDGVRLMFYRSKRSKYPCLSFRLSQKKMQPSTNDSTNRYENNFKISNNGFKEIELSNLMKIQKTSECGINFICEGGAITSFRQGDLYSLRQTGVADFVMKALHQDDIEIAICGGVPPCISLFAAVVERITISVEEIRPAAFPSSSGTSSSEDGDKREKRARRRFKRDTTDFRFKYIILHILFYLAHHNFNSSIKCP